MRTERIQVRDLYESAWLLSNGFHLEQMLVSNNGKVTVTFVITGNGVTSSIETFRSGQAKGNVPLFTFTLEKLKDRMFEQLRNRDRRENNGKNTPRRNRAAKTGN